MTEILAHGLGGSTDLPVPYRYALVGAAWALTFTFAALAFAWRKPRFNADAPGRQLPVWVTSVVDSRWMRGCLAVLALLFAIWAVIVGIYGPQDQSNALVGMIYVLLWVGLVAVSAAVGPVWRVISPMRTVYRILHLPTVFRTYPDRWGYFPAAIGLFAFVWLELASPNPAALDAVRLWLLAYAVIVLGGAVVFGERWFARADPFEVYGTAVSRLSPFWRNGLGRIVIGNPLHHLPSLPIRPGIVTVLAILLGSTAFDSFSATPAWRNFADGVADSTTIVPDSVGQSLVSTAGLLVFAGVVGLTFCLAAQATGGVDRQQRRALPGQLAHTLIPIVVGYIFAHYLTYLVERGQQTVIALLGLGDVQVAYVLSSHPLVLATVKVLFVVAGHIAAVVAAHDRALRLLPAGHQLTGQLAMMFTMVAYTFTGLYLLFSA